MNGPSESRDFFHQVNTNRNQPLPQYSVREDNFSTTEEEIRPIQGQPTRILLKTT